MMFGYPEKSKYNPGEILVIDDFLPSKVIEKICQYVYQSEISWTIQRSVSGNKNHLEFLMHDCSHVELFSKHLFKKIQERLDRKYDLIRVYMNGQWHGRDGSFHHDDGELTVLYYLSEYTLGWGGHTEIFKSQTPGETETIAIRPDFNRLVIFPAKNIHKGYSFTDPNAPMRLSIAWKLI